MRYGLIFAGQGLQHSDTLPWLANDGGTRLLRQTFGADWRSHMSDDAWSQRNDVAQPLLTGLALCAWQQIALGLQPPAVVAGYSVGELAAFCVAGVFDADDAMVLARHRAAAMDQAAAGVATGMLGISGLAPPDIEALCADFGLVLAIRSGVSTVVLGGLRERLPLAAAAAAAKGAQATALRVTLASHTPWMRSATTEFAKALEHTVCHRPRFRLISNVSGHAVTDGDIARQLLARQIAEPMYWDACMEAMVERGVRCVLEVGAGCALTRLWNERFRAIPARAADEFRSAQAVRDWLERHAQ